MHSGKLYDLDSSYIQGHRIKDYFDEKELAEIVVQFEPDQHADFANDIGAKIVIHSPSHVGSIRESGYDILPGFKYEFFISKRIERRLPPPYSSDCYDYKKMNEYHFTKKKNSKPSVELDKTVCIQNCMTRATLDTCNCWPLDSPYFTNDEMFMNSSRNVKVCLWNIESFDHTEGKMYTKIINTI